MAHAGRGVWTVTLPLETIGQDPASKPSPDDIEYYVQVGTESANGPVWPATAPGINQVVTWIDSKL